MREKVDQFILKCRFKAMESFMKEEKGASDMVVVVILIIIVIAVAVIFKDGLEKLTKKAFDGMMEFLK